MATVSHEAYLTEESEIADVSRLGPKGCFIQIYNRDTSDNSAISAIVSRVYLVEGYV
ncbi:hypothetical protein DPMN_155265 [Dreissena polymorpha]|uniref:Uncharacterized protein n=1 Tax=Dreissena polymorpha TaxID=45954 RepID=A0A9D4FLY3_DREPO|nr:hypothetical protein DPMN_155265 [Dreissena polymorpha]